MTRDNQHIMILRFSALGDVAMTLPVVYSAAKAYPDVKFSMVTRPFFARLFMNRPKNLDVVAINPKDYSGVTGTARLLGRLGRLRPTAVADLHNVLRTWIIDNYFRCRGVRVAMVNKQRSDRSKALKTGSLQRSFIERYRDVLAELGLKFELTFNSLFPTAPQLPEPVEQPAIGIAPFARYFNKTYPPEMMRRVAERLCKRGINVYLFGGRGDEAATLEEWAAEIDGCRSVAGRYGIEDELALMSALKLMVSMDSANQHLASLTGTRVLTIWGSTTPECGFTPYGQDESSAMVARTECQPCTVAGAPACPLGHFNCMRQLNPEAVADRIISIVNYESD